METSRLWFFPLIESTLQSLTSLSIKPQHQVHQDGISRHPLIGWHSLTLLVGLVSLLGDCGTTGLTWTQGFNVQKIDRTLGKLWSGLLSDDQILTSKPGCCFFIFLLVVLVVYFLIFSSSSSFSSTLSSPLPLPPLSSFSFFLFFFTCWVFNDSSLLHSTLLSLLHLTFL